MAEINPSLRSLGTYFFVLLIMILFALWMKSLPVETEWHQTGIVNFSLGFVLLAAYASANLLKLLKLPMLSGYIFSGIIAGPYISGFLDFEMVDRLRLIDDLALSFIAMTAGGELHLQSLKRQAGIISLNILFQALIIFFGVFLFIFFAGRYFDISNNFSRPQLIAFAMLMGGIAIARSPSFAIGIISECRASGAFTEMVIGVTIAIDVFNIIFFTIVLTAAQLILSESRTIDYYTFIMLFYEIAASFFIGMLIGKLISAYIRLAGRHLPLFILFLAFSITKSCMAVTDLMWENFNIHFKLEPLLICMSAGFTVQNFSREGRFFMENLEKISLPIFLLFFSIAGAALNINSLRLCWPLALSLFFVRIIGLFIATWTAGTINNDPAIYKNKAWMAYITQAAVAIGLAQMVERYLSEIGIHLTTVVMALITLNMLIGPITLKMVLNMVGEAKK